VVFTLSSEAGDEKPIFCCYLATSFFITAYYCMIKWVLFFHLAIQAIFPFWLNRNFTARIYIFDAAIW
jgi:hypothetical protein